MQYKCKIELRKNVHSLTINKQDFLIRKMTDCKLQLYGYKTEMSVETSTSMQIATNINKITNVSINDL
jgi:hypothetical protein